jgi:hypothetical protein
VKGHQRKGKATFQEKKMEKRKKKKPRKEYFVAFLVGVRMHGKALSCYLV